MKKEMKEVADYSWLGKTKRSWHLWLGNPFCVSKYVISLKKATEKELTSLAKEESKKEKIRFVRLFPDVKW